MIGLNLKKFSEVRYSGEFVGFLKDSLTLKLGIKNKIKLINGGYDQYCASIGAGILDTKEILLSTGTAWVIFKMTNKPVFDTQRFFIPGRNIIKDKFGLIYKIPSAGAIK